VSSVAANRRGILAMLAAMTLFTANDTLLKLASDALAPGQIMAVRGLFASLFALGLVTAFGEWRRLPAIASPLVLLRAGFEAATAFLYITALAHLPLANITALLLASPILMTLLTVMLGMERVGPRRWAAILAGFAGVLAIVRPSVEGFNLYAGLALASAFMVVGRDFTTRLIGGRVPSAVVTLSTTASVTAAGFALGLTEEWRAPDPPHLLLLAGAAALVTLGNLSIVLAFRQADIAVVSPFRYAVALLALAAGYAVFGEVPDPLSTFGIALIVGSGVYTIHRERLRARLEAARPLEAAVGRAEEP
jgi:drug/metabolite transporter (DMT)-like permease